MARRRRLIALGALVGTTTLVAVISYAVPKIIDRLTTSDSPPITVTVVSDPSRVSGFDSTERAVAVPGTAAPAPDPGPRCGDLYPWSRANGGADAGASRLHLLVRGADEGQVVITEIRAVIEERAPKVPSHQLYCLPEGELTSRVVSIDLDDERPVAKYETADGKPFGFTVAPGEVEAFLITATVARATARWHLAIDVTAGSEQHTVEVDDGGEPFRTAPIPQGGRWLWVGTGWEPRGLPAGATAPAPVPPGRPLPQLPTA
ncbi:hypothetical protein K1W54_42435 [Micromonospora sp. CPCC 205371]|nr:hypothetical protein [Micromonospora sp. CPCC 205371]